MNGKPQVKRKLGHEVQIYVFRFKVILDLSISGCNTLTCLNMIFLGKVNSQTQLGDVRKVAKLIPEETISHIFFVPFSLKGCLTQTI